MKKIISIVGARPQFIKSAAVSRALKKDFKEILVHTGQHYDYNMSDIFFEELGIDKNHINLAVGSASHAVQTAQMMMKLETVFIQENADAVLVYGDTNSTLAAALVAAKLHIPVFHVEAGLRSFNKSMPEEVNRIMTDHLSDLLFCPTETAVNHLKNEAITKGVSLSGDVMYDAVKLFSSDAKTKLDYPYAALTMHRPQNADNPTFLDSFFSYLNKRSEQFIFPVHPRIKANIEVLFQGKNITNIKLIEPLGYIEMLNFLKHANFLLTDSGGLQKEAMFLETPCITLRDETEWVETVDFGWNKIVGQNIELLDKTIQDIDNYPKKDCLKFGDGKAAQKITASIKQYFME